MRELADSHRETALAVALDVEEQREKDYRKIFDVNFFGAVALLRLTLPSMRACGKGMIVNVSSVHGVSSLPANGYYSASKFALEDITEALWQEIEPLGLKALLIEPGSFRTGMATRTHFSGDLMPDYDATSGKFHRANAKYFGRHVRPETGCGGDLHCTQVRSDRAPDHPGIRRVRKYRSEDRGSTIGLCGLEGDRAQY
jgi:NAD(P)-dependent dehydrogenase (short-subunit alcohol dehydrogenase family)